MCIRDSIKAAPKAERSANHAADLAKYACNCEECACEEVVEEETCDLSSLTLADLKAMCKERGIKGYSTLKKDEIIALLSK